MSTARLILCSALALALLLGAGYKRASFKHWTDADQDCKDTRAEVLEAQSVREVGFGVDGCRVVLGEWVDPYGGKTYARAADLDVDHLIPLEHAWRMGARDWSAADREAYANWEPGLLAVSASLNRQKGAKDPSEWLPPAMDRCVYVRRWVGVARHWHLALPVGVADMLVECTLEGEAE